MAGPITWRNVGMPNFGSSNQLQIAAGDQINAGIAQLGRAADTYRQGQIDAEQQTKDFNTQNFLSRVNGFNNIDGYDQFSSTINKELAQLNPSQVDAAQVQNSLNSRDDTLMQETTARNAFNDKPILSDINARIVNNDLEGANALVGRLSGDSRGQGQTLISQATTAAENTRQNEVISTGFNNYLLNNASNVGEAQVAAQQFVNENGITGERAANILNTAGDTFTGLTGTSERQNFNRDAGVSRLEAAHSAKLADLEATHKGSLTLKDGEYEEYRSVADFEGTPQEFMKRVYQGTLDEDGNIPQDSRIYHTWKALTHDRDSDVREAEDLVNRTLLGDTTPSGASGTYKQLRDLAAELTGDEKGGTLPRHVTDAARKYALMESLGSATGDLNIDLYRSVYEKELLRAMQMEVNHNADLAKTNAYNANVALTRSRQQDEILKFKTKANNQNLRKAGKT